MNTPGSGTNAEAEKQPTTKLDYFMSTYQKVFEKLSSDEQHVLNARDLMWPGTSDRFFVGLTKYVQQNEGYLNSHSFQEMLRDKIEGKFREAVDKIKKAGNEPMSEKLKAVLDKIVKKMKDLNIASGGAPANASDGSSNKIPEGSILGGINSVKSKLVQGNIWESIRAAMKWVRNAVRRILGVSTPAVSAAMDRGDAKLGVNSAPAEVGDKGDSPPSEEKTFGSEAYAEAKAKAEKDAEEKETPTVAELPKSEAANDNAIEDADAQKVDTKADTPKDLAA